MERTGARENREEQRAEGQELAGRRPKAANRYLMRTHADARAYACLCSQSGWQEYGRSIYPPNLYLETLNSIYRKFALIRIFRKFPEP